MRESIRYIADDGQVFDTEDEAVLHDVETHVAAANITFYDENLNIIKNVDRFDEAKYIYCDNDDVSVIEDALSAVDDYVGLDRVDPIKPHCVLIYADEEFIPMEVFTTADSYINILNAVQQILSNVEKIKNGVVE